jgi:hypothetical protein
VFIKSVGEGYWEEIELSNSEDDAENQKTEKQKRLDRVLEVTSKVVTIGAAVIGAAAGIKGLRKPKP